MREQTKRAPIQTLRDGAVVVKIWEQQGPNGPYVTATLGRTYKNEQTGEYGESRSMSGSDVLKAQALLGEANREMVQWRDYYKDVARQKDPAQAESQQPGVEANTTVPGSAPGATEQHQPTQVQNRDQAQGLAAQRDAALAGAKTPSRNIAPDRGHER